MNGIPKIVAHSRALPIDSRVSAILGIVVCRPPTQELLNEWTRMFETIRVRTNITHSLVEFSAVADGRMAMMMVTVTKTKASLPHTQSLCHECAGACSHVSATNVLHRLFVQISTNGKTIVHLVSARKLGHNTNDDRVYAAVRQRRAAAPKVRVKVICVRLIAVSNRVLGPPRNHARRNVTRARGVDAVSRWRLLPPPPWSCELCGWARTLHRAVLRCTISMSRCIVSIERAYKIL